QSARRQSRALQFKPHRNDPGGPFRRKIARRQLVGRGSDQREPFKGRSDRLQFQRRRSALCEAEASQVRKRDTAPRQSRRHRREKADFAQADLSLASLNDANLSRADLTGSFVYGVSAWNVELKGAVQRDLRITRSNEGVITVDDIKIAQFLYTLLNNKNV